eukprot:CAMPEP_0114369408 /NCGR_PEP_ID=MMETSP0101-20121206/31646_1 /TAXON_ID=38822 ORGANISM="Pteridomonas danica, Strain PT" /NCGR_SAMPLE_ID=MMETSP0101 /ASSEMBLY_ACC=CAM_ASM_000211 /LENGTH=583 /DNA_ID=CAMNT_0001520239 /DNA_START=2429 /DNA_END=4180 /DNA_ORIENTATION=-
MDEAKQALKSGIPVIDLSDVKFGETSSSSTTPAPFPPLSSPSSSPSSSSSSSSSSPPSSPSLASSLLNRDSSIAEPIDSKNQGESVRKPQPPPHQLHRSTISLGGVSLQTSTMGGVKTGIIMSLHGPCDLDVFDKEFFQHREVVLACSIPRRWLNSISSLQPRDEKGSGDGGFGTEGVASSSNALHVISGEALNAIRGSYFGHILDPRPWYEGGIFLPPKVIHRAYQLLENNEAENSPHNDYELKNILKSDRPSVLKRTSISLKSSSSMHLMRPKKKHQLILPSNCRDFVDSMAQIRQVCASNGWAPVYHFTQTCFAPLIMKTGIRMSIQGQGDGGVYFSTKGPASYGLGTPDYEINIIIDCFGDSRLEEYRGKHLLDLVIVYGAHPQMLSPAPGGRHNAVMVKKSDFEALALPHQDGNYFLRPDRILGMFYIDTSTKLKGLGEAKDGLFFEEKKDLETLTLLSQAEGKMSENEQQVNRIRSRTCFDESMIEEVEKKSNYTSSRKNFTKSTSRPSSILGFPFLTRTSSSSSSSTTKNKRFSSRGSSNASMNVYVRNDSKISNQDVDVDNSSVSNPMNAFSVSV